MKKLIIISILLLSACGLKSQIDSNVYTYKNDSAPTVGGVHFDTTGYLMQSNALLNVYK